MLSQLVLAGFMTHERNEFTFNADGATTIYGPSECGKSSIIDGLTFVLWGLDRDGEDFPSDAIRDGDARVEVELTTSWGKTLRRTMTSRRSTTRTIVEDGDSTSIAVESAWRQQLGPIGARPDVARLIMVPFQWVDLLRRELGRPLRDIILSLLPNVDSRAVIAELMATAGKAMKSTDPMDEDAAKRLQTMANRGRDEAKGRLEEARNRAHAVGSATPVQVDASELAAAKAVMKAAEAWRTYDRNERVRAEKARAVARQAAERDAWRKRAAELGERPTYDAAALQAAELAERNASAARAKAHDAYQSAARDYARAAAELKALQAAAACPTCHRPFDETPDTTDAAALVAKLEADGHAARASLDTASAALTEAQGAFRRLQEGAAAARSWDAAQRALGREPSVDAAPEAVAQPEHPNPTPSEVKVADAVYTAHYQSQGAAERQAKEAAEAKSALVAAEGTAASMAAEAERVSVLLDCIRRAPTEIAARQAASLPRMKHVSWRFPPAENSKTPAMEVLIDGRPWKRASTGKRILADLEMRVVLRELAGLDPLPIFVDNAQDWSGEWPEVAGPVVYLVTRPGAMTVVAGAPEVTRA